MGIGIAILVIFITFVIIKNIIKFSIKAVCFIILAIVLSATIFTCINMPDMHKPVSLSTIEYLLKFNKDGSIDTTKQITQTVYKEQAK